MVRMQRRLSAGGSGPLDRWPHRVEVVGAARSFPAVDPGLGPLGKPSAGGLDASSAGEASPAIARNFSVGGLRKSSFPP